MMEPLICCVMFVVAFVAGIIPLVFHFIRVSRAHAKVSFRCGEAVSFLRRRLTFVKSNVIVLVKMPCSRPR